MVGIGGIHLNGAGCYDSDAISADSIYTDANLIQSVYPGCRIWINSLSFCHFCHFLKAAVDLALMCWRRRCIMGCSTFQVFRWQLHKVHK